MAYKFQLGSARMSGSLVQEGDLTLSGSMTFKSGEKLTIGSAELTEAELEQIDGITAGTVAASKAVVVDASKDASGFRNIDGTGDLTMGTIGMTGFSVDADGDTALKSLAVDNSSTIGCDADADIMTLAAQSLALANDVDFNVAKAGGLQIAGTAVTATAAELNYLDNDALTAADITKLAAIDASATELNYLDLTNAIGTVAASEAVVLDASKDASGFRNLGAVQLTTSGRVIVDDATEATSTTDGSLQTDGGLSVAKSAVIGDDLDLLSDAAILNFGADKDVSLTHVPDNGLLLNGSMALQFGDSATNIMQISDSNLEIAADGSLILNTPVVDLEDDGVIVKFGDDSDVSLTHVADTGLLLNSSRQLQFGDSGTYIHQSADGVLDLVADTEIEINATTVDINGAVDASSTIVAASSITAGTSFIIGSADLNEADMEQIDGVTAGTAAASKAVVLDASKDIAGLNDVSAAGLTLSDLDEGGILFAGTDGALNTSVDYLQWAEDREENDGYIALFVSSSASGSAALGDGMFMLTDAEDADICLIDADGAEFAVDVNVDADLSGSGNFSIGGTLSADNLASVAVALGDDMMVIDDGASGAIKTTSLANYSTAIAGAGLLSTAGVLAVVNATNGGLTVNANDMQVTLNDLAAAAVDVANDSLAIVDATDNGSKKESIADLVSAMAGAGLTATNGVLSSDASPTPTDHGDAAATLVEGLNFTDTDFTAARTWTLPASPDAGDVVVVKAPASAGTYNLTIAKAGSQTIDGQTSVVIESAYGAIELVYAMNNMWVIK